MAENRRSETELRALEARERERQAHQQGRAPPPGQRDEEVREELEQAGRREEEGEQRRVESSHVVD